MNAPSFCWHCGGALGKRFRQPGEQATWKTITDPLGNEHRVHAVCEQDAREWMRQRSETKPRYIWDGGL